MADYLRPRVPGATIYFTVALAQRPSTLLLDEVERLRVAVRRTMGERPFEIDCWVTLPDEVHCIWTLPAGDADFSTRWRLIKTRFSRDLAKGPLRPSHVARGERGIWQRRFWEHHIRDAVDLEIHRRAVWFAPVREGLVARPEDWQASSYLRDMGRVRDITHPTGNLSRGVRHAGGVLPPIGTPPTQSAQV